MSSSQTVTSKLIQFPVSGISFKKKNVRYILHLFSRDFDNAGSTRDRKNIDPPFYSLHSFRPLVVELVPEPKNKYDKNAIKVVVQGTDADGGICIGYVPKNLTNKIAPSLEMGNAFLLDIGVFSAGYYARINFISIPKAPTSELPSAEVWNMARAPS